MTATTAPVPRLLPRWAARAAVAAWSLHGFRWLALACEAATILLTWPLWQVRGAPPMLPLLPLPRFDLGYLLLLSLGVVLFRPALGLALHSVLLAYAVLIDQTRLQPEVVSLTILLWGTLHSPSARAVARAHLVALWCWSGVNKLLSPDFVEPDGLARWMARAFTDRPPALLEQNFGYAVALAELALGVMALFPRTRRAAAPGALFLHGGILLVLSPLGHHWNEAIWPWNVTLAFAGLALIAPWRGPLTAWFRALPALTRAAVVALLITPAGSYAGLMDAYLAHHLYSGSVPETEWCDAAAWCRPAVETQETFERFNVPIPPEHRLLRAYFSRTCHPGDRLLIYDSRGWARLRGTDRQEVGCPNH